MHLFQALFLDFQIQQLAILKQVEVGKNYIPQKKEIIIIQALFLDLQIQQLAILKPVEVGKSYIPQKKPL